MPIALIGLLPTIVQVLSGLVSDAHLFKDKDVEHITGIVMQVMAGIPEAVAAFTRFKNSLGGAKPTFDQLMALKGEVAHNTEVIEALRQAAHDRAANKT